MQWDGDDYQRRVEEVTATIDSPHGEADLVGRYQPRHVLDAGCGTGRVAVELHRRGTEVVGVDLDASMLATARRIGPDQDWIEADLTTLALERTFDVVLLAGNVPLFTAPGTTAALVAACSRHVGEGGVLIAGFSTDRDYPLERWDAETSAAGLELIDRWASWDLEPFTTRSDYAVSVHRPAHVAG